MYIIRKHNKIWLQPTSLQAYTLQLTKVDKRSTNKWVLSSSPNGWQGPNGSHQWEMVEALLCIR